MARRAAVAQLAAATLSERLDRMLDVGVSLATRVRFAELVAAGQWDAAIQVMKSVPADFRFVERVALFDARGTAMAAFPESSVRGQNFASREWYTGVSREWKPHVSGHLPAFDAAAARGIRRGGAGDGPRRRARRHPADAGPARALLRLGAGHRPWRR